MYDGNLDSYHHHDTVRPKRVREIFHLWYAIGRYVAWNRREDGTYPEDSDIEEEIPEEPLPKRKSKKPRRFTQRQSLVEAEAREQRLAARAARLAEYDEDISTMSALGGVFALFRTLKVLARRRRVARGIALGPPRYLVTLLWLSVAAWHGAAHTERKRRV